MYDMNHQKEIYAFKLALHKLLNEPRANFRFDSVSCSAFAIFVLEFCLDWKTKMAQRTFTAEEGL